jgi:hypothetical protein
VPWPIVIDYVGVFGEIWKSLVYAVIDVAGSLLSGLQFKGIW